MIRFRRRYTLQRIMLMIAALGLVLGLSLTLVQPLYTAALAMVGIIIVFASDGFPFAEILMRPIKTSSTGKFRTRYSLQRLMAMVAVMALPLAIVKPMYAGVPLAISLALLFVIEGLTLIEMMVVMSICGVLTGLLLPSVSGHGPRRRRPVPPALVAPLVPQATSGEQYDDPIMCLPDPDSPAPSHTMPVPPSQP